MDTLSDEKLLKQISSAQFYLLRYETEFTPCTGITAVARQERRHFKHGVMIAPWCPKLKRDDAQKDDPILNGKVKVTDWKFDLNGKTCTVLTTNDEFSPILFLAIEGRFQGINDPYDVPLSTLHEDTLYFGLAVNEVLKSIGSAKQFVWGADWESVPALALVRERHLIALTLHNSFDECLEGESQTFGETYAVFRSKRESNQMTRTALEIGLEIADVVTTVNRGFAYGLLHEPIQTRVMAEHLQHLLGRVVGIDNAAFAELKPFSNQFKEAYRSDPKKGAEVLFKGQAELRAQLPEEVCKAIGNKVLVVSMGRRVSQKMHEVLVESAARILKKDPDFPLFLFFATRNGDGSSKARLTKLKEFQKKFPNNAACTDGPLPYYGLLMQAAEYNCMPSLYEPHGGVYANTVIPIARAIDGLAEQICGLNPKGEAARMNKLWHSKKESPSGLLFREDPATDEAQLVSDLRELLCGKFSPKNKLFNALAAALAETLVEAVDLRIRQPEQYAELVLAAIEKQESTSWEVNLKGMLALIKEAREKRSLETK